MNARPALVTGGNNTPFYPIFSVPRRQPSGQGGRQAQSGARLVTVGGWKLAEPDFEPEPALRGARPFPRTPLSPQGSPPLDSPLTLSSRG